VFSFTLRPFKAEKKLPVLIEYKAKWDSELF
jgi:hypothetical protein